MSRTRCDRTPAWAALQAAFNTSGRTFDARVALAHEPNRFEALSQQAPHVFADLSKNLLDAPTEQLLLDLAQPRQVRAWSDSGLWYQMLALLDRLRILASRQVLPPRPSTPPCNVFTHPDWIRKAVRAPKEPRG